MKIRSLGPEFLHADGRTDGRTDRQSLRNFQSLFTTLQTSLKPAPNFLISITVSSIIPHREPGK
jgi:hypothetical protein